MSPFGYVIIVISLLAIIFAIHKIRSNKNRKVEKKDYVWGVVIILALTAIGFASQMKEIKSINNSSSSESIYQAPGTKIKSSLSKKDKDGFYYVARSNHKMHYFVGDGNKITAAKYVYDADHMGYTDMQSTISSMLNDKNVKYGNSKMSADETQLKGDNYNVYSPKHKKWYHVSIQHDSDGKVSSFSMWAGKNGTVTY